MVADLQDIFLETKIFFILNTYISKILSLYIKIMICITNIIWLSNFLFYSFIRKTKAAFYLTLVALFV